MNSCNDYLQVESPDKKGSNSLNDYLQVERRKTTKFKAIFRLKLHLNCSPFDFNSLTATQARKNLKSE